MMEKSKGIQATKNSYWDHLKPIQSQQLPLWKEKSHQEWGANNGINI